MTSSQSSRFKHLLGLTLVTLLLASCGGGNGSSSLPVQPSGTTFGPNFSEIQANVFTPTCATTGCHFGAGAPQGLRLDEANSYGLLVGVASGEASSILRVAAGDPNNSYLIQKLEGTASVGARMPLNAPALDRAAIDTIRQWITDGAIDDRAPSSGPIRVSSLSPLPDNMLTAAPSSVLAMFDRELDVSTVNAMTFVLEASGGDTTFGDGNETSITATSIATTATSATFDLSGVTLADDTYRVRLFGSGASIVMDLEANALDGEYSGTFPSGNGTAGGDFEVVFSISTPASGATLDDIQANVFTPTCSTSGCHTGPTGGGLPSGMDLSDADASFASLVGTSSIQQPSLSRVEAGDPDNSYLVQKVEGTAASGLRMPLGGTPLDQATIDDIRQWIFDGANR